MGYLTPDKMLATFCELTPSELQQRGIDVLLMDIDNTLAPYEQPEPDERILTWLEGLQAAGIRLAFVSNNNWERVELFNQKIGIQAHAKSGKPFGKKLRQVIRSYGSDVSHAAILGDQLLTDVFAGKHIGATAFLVPPIKDKTTAFWRIKRALERPIIKKYVKNHPEQAACAAFWLRKDKKMSFATFGPGGNCDWFYAEGNKATVQAPGWLSSKGLDSYEYEAGRGVNASEASLRAVGEKAKQYGIHMSLHAPYFISLSGTEEATRLKSIDYITKSLWAAELLGAKTIVIHSGSAGKISREHAMSLSKDTLAKVAEAVGDTEIKLGIETMGKVNQLGTLDEVIEQCKVDKKFVPVVDFGHLNARVCGNAFPDVDAYREVFDRIGTQLGDEVAKYMHCHFSKIEFTGAGEKRHVTFEDTVYGPRFEPLIEAIIREGVCPNIICESDGTMTADALAMKNYYNELRG